MAKRTEKTDPKLAESIVRKIKSEVDSGSEVAASLAKHKVKANFYYYHLKRLGLSSGAKEKNRPLKQIEIKELMPKNGKTLIVITEDQATVFNIISTYTRG